jgi:hypothetical protein
MSAYPQLYRHEIPVICRLRATILPIVDGLGVHVGEGGSATTYQRHGEPLTQWNSAMEAVNVGPTSHA